MGNILKEESLDETEWTSVEQDMRFYCSYCMLTNTDPKVVTLSEDTGSNPMSSVVHSLKEQGVNVSIQEDRSHNAFSFIMYRSRINVYTLSQSIIDVLRSSKSAYKKSANITECKDYIVYQAQTSNGSFIINLRLYKHSRNTLPLTLSTIEDFREHVGVDEEDKIIATICYMAQRYKISNSFKSILGILSKKREIMYCLPENKTLSTVSYRDIEDSILEKVNKTRESLTDQELFNLQGNIQLLHTPENVPVLDPYTRHGKIINYERLWSFIHCCKDFLPVCQLGHLCRKILKIHFRLAEKRIEEYAFTLRTA